MWEIEIAGTTLIKGPPRTVKAMGTERNMEMDSRKRDAVLGRPGLESRSC